MNTIFPEIEEITHLDKKNLMATFAKLGEEHGELARVLLAYANEPTILHRFATTNDILEECVDITLVALSIAFKAGLSQEQLENMFRIKMNKWADIISREGRLKDIKSIPFEIHVTCSQHGFHDFAECFKVACQSAGVKPISLKLTNTNTNEVMMDNMTSSKFFGTNSEAISEANRIAAIMRNHNVSVDRIKIETVPWHPSAPQTNEEKMPENGYFVSHIAVHYVDHKSEALQTICKLHNAHYSKNINKNNDTLMCTIRVYTNRFQFDNLVNNFCSDLRANMFTYEPVISEFSLYDSNHDHDKIWLS